MLNAAIKGARVFARPAHVSLWAIFDCLVMFLVQRQSPLPQAANKLTHKIMINTVVKYTNHATIKIGFEEKLICLNTKEPTIYATTKYTSEIASKLFLILNQ